MNISDVIKHDHDLRRSAQLKINPASTMPAMQKKQLIDISLIAIFFFLVTPCQIHSLKRMLNLLKNSQAQLSRSQAQQMSAPKRELRASSKQKEKPTLFSVCEMSKMGKRPPRSTEAVILVRTEVCEDCEKLKDKANEHLRLSNKAVCVSR